MATHTIKKIFALTAAALSAFVLALTPVRDAIAAHDLPASSFTQYQNTDLYYSPSVSSDEIYTNGVCLLSVPENVRARLINDDVRIYLIAYSDEVLTSRKITEYGDSRIEIAGLTTHPTFRKYIYTDTGEIAYVKRITNGMIEIQTNVPANMEINPYRLIHEIGHYVDTAAGAATGTYFAISSSSDFQNFYKKYGDKIVQYSAYKAAPSLYNVNECWADCFRMAYSDAATLRAISQDLYNFVVCKTAALPAVEPSLTAQ